jgi:hypothetical protein
MHARKNLPPHRWHYHIICIHECLLRHYEKRSMVSGVPIVSIEETFIMLLILLVLRNTRTSHTRKRWENSFGFTWHNMTMWQTRRTLFMLQITDLHNIKAYQCSYANGDNSLHNNTKADRNTGQEWAIITAYLGPLRNLSSPLRFAIFGKLVLGHSIKTGVTPPAPRAAVRS